MVFDLHQPDFKSFIAIWRGVFVWTLLSSMFVHAIGAAVALVALWKHKIGKFVAGLLVFVGVFGPLTLGTVNSAAIAFVYRSTAFSMPPLHALLWGVGLTVVGMFLAFSRLLATL